MNMAYAADRTVRATLRVILMHRCYDPFFKSFVAVCNPARVRLSVSATVTFDVTVACFVQCIISITHTACISTPLITLPNHFESSTQYVHTTEQPMNQSPYVQACCYVGGQHLQLMVLCGSKTPPVLGIQLCCVDFGLCRSSYTETTP